MCQTKSDDKCPCEGCVLVALCRNKVIIKLLEECELFKAYYTDYTHEKFVKIYEALNPTHEEWKTIFDKKMTVKINDQGGYTYHTKFKPGKDLLESFKNLGKHLEDVDLFGTRS